MNLKLEADKQKEVNKYNIIRYSDSVPLLYQGVRIKYTTITWG